MSGRKAGGRAVSSGNEFLEKALEKLDTLRSIRRDIHRHPELGMQETRTAALIAEHLRDLKVEVETGVAGTGVVGLLRGNAKGKTVALRADIDALPMQELKGSPYASETPGVAHSCGHDAHTAIQLGAAMLLSERRDTLAGNVKFIFQPSEDTLPGGALPMIQAGVLDKPEVDAIFSLHLLFSAAGSRRVLVAGHRQCQGGFHPAAAQPAFRFR